MEKVGQWDKDLGVSYSWPFPGHHESNQLSSAPYSCCCDALPMQQGQESMTEKRLHKPKTKTLPLKLIQPGISRLT